MQLHRKLLSTATPVLLLVAATIPSANAATAKAGGVCTNAGSTSVIAGVKFTCNKSRSKLQWDKGVKVGPNSVVPTATKSTISKISLPEFVNLAQTAITNSENGIPGISPPNSIQISSSSKNNLPNFLTASTANKFTFFGPTPLAEKTGNRAGAMALITSDNRKVYKSQEATPPWAAGFKLTTSDSHGRFTLVTSGSGDPSQQYSWRLAYKSGSGSWKYQSIAGVSHPSNNQKYFDEVALGAAGSYSIRLEFLAMTTFYGVGLKDSPTSLTPLLSSQALRVAILGDSWVTPSFYEAGPIFDWDGYPGVLSWLTGWNVISAGVRGQGYLQPTGPETYKDRVVRDLVPQNPEVVFFTGSSNDHLFPDKQIADEMGKDILALQKAAPNILIIVCSPYETGGDQKAPGQSKAMQAVAKTLGIPYIDFITLPLFDQSNNGQNQLANGHPTRTGSGYIAAELLKRIAGLL